MKQRTAKKIRSKKDTICCKTQGEGEKIFFALCILRKSRKSDELLAAST